MFRLLVSQVRDYAIFMLDTEGHVATWNEGAERIKGYTAADIIGSHFSRFYPEEDRRAGKPEWELEIATRDGRFEDEDWRVRKDGTRFWANVVITALKDDSGELRGFAKVTRDITSRHEEEQQRAESQRQEADQLRAHATRAAELEASKSDFLNLASHELRGPVALLRGYVSMIVDGDLDIDGIQRIAPLLSGRLAQMELLIKQMLETARLEQGVLDIASEVVDLCTVTTEQVSDYQPVAAPEKRIQLDIPDSPVYVLGDRTRIATIVANLLDNAIKYSPDGSVVRVFVARRGDRAFVGVADTGTGIAAGDVGKLFQRFTRLETEQNKTIGGTGLGLYLCRHIARRHGGDILVDSTLGVGSNFTLSLPHRET